MLLVYIDDDVRRVLDAFRVHEGIAKPVLRRDGERFGLRTHGITRAEALTNGLMGRSVLVSQAMERFYLARDARFYLQKGWAEGHLSLEGNRFLAAYLYDAWVAAGLPGAARRPAVAR